MAVVNPVSNVLVFICHKYLSGRVYSVLKCNCPLQVLPGSDYQSMQMVHWYNNCYLSIRRMSLKLLRDLESNTF